LVEEVKERINRSSFILLTGGEPALQLDQELVDALKGYRLHVETNGTLELPDKIHWITVSPKVSVMASVMGGCSELKWIVENEESIGKLSQFIEYWKYEGHVALQPLDNDPKAIEVAYRASLWTGYQLSLQTHKLIGKK